MNPCGNVFCRVFGRLFDVWSQSGRGKMAEKSAISAVPRRHLFIVQIDVPRKLKKSKTIPRLKVRKVRAYQCAPQHCQSRWKKRTFRFRKSLSCVSFRSRLSLQPKNFVPRGGQLVTVHCIYQHSLEMGGRGRGDLSIFVMKIGTRVSPVPNLLIGIFQIC